MIPAHILHGSPDNSGNVAGNRSALKSGSRSLGVARKKGGIRIEKEPFPRRWSATITYADNPLGVYDEKYSETVEADLSEEDLQRSQAKAAYAEAVTYLLAGLAKHAEVQLYKTTKKHGRTKDHTSYSIDQQDAVNWAMKQITK